MPFPLRFAAAFVVALCLQVGVNYANDYFDAVKGVDAPERIGPPRATATGLVTPQQMKAASALAIGVAVAVGGALSVATDPRLMVVGAIAVIAALGYSGGPRPYGHRALGELSVFVFFGLVATCGSAYVQVRTVPAGVVLASIPVGLLAVALLVANNMRDAVSDARAGKRTLAVRIGGSQSRVLFSSLVLVAFAFLPGIVASSGKNATLVALASAPLALVALSQVRRGGDILRSTAGLHLAFGLLLAFGLAL